MAFGQKPGDGAAHPPPPGVEAGDAGPASPGSAAVLTRARERGEEGDWEGMAEELREALEDYGEDPAILCWLGVAERELGMDGIAYERFKQALAQDPEDPYILTTAGGALAHFDDPDAETALRVSSVLAPNMALTRWMYGAYLAREGLHDDARRELAEARTLAPEDPVVAYESGAAYALAGERDHALAELAVAVDLAPYDGWARVVLGLLLVEDDRPEEALAELDAGARERPEDVEAQLLASLVHAVLETGDAWEFLERARLNAQGTDVLSVEAVEERLSDGPEAARRLLRSTLAPSVLRERLQTRP